MPIGRANLGFVSRWRNEARRSLAWFESCLPFHEQNFFGVVDFGELHFDYFIVRGLHDAADKGGFDGDFAMAAIDKHEKLYLAGAAVGEQGVERSTRGAASVEDVVDEHDLFALDRKANGVLLYDWLGAKRRKIIAIERDVKRSNRDRFFFDLLNHFPETLGDGDAAATNANKTQTLDSTVFLENFMSESYQRTLDFRGRHELGFLAQSGGSAECMFFYGHEVSFRLQGQGIQHADTSCRLMPGF